MVLVHDIPTVLQTSVPLRLTSELLTVLAVSMRPFDLAVDGKLSYLLEVNGKIHVFTEKKYIY